MFSGSNGSLADPTFGLDAQDPSEAVPSHESQIDAYDMFRFLHISDVHLDTTFTARRPEIRAHLRRETREALGRAISYAIEHDLDAVLIAGDLFDGERLSFATERFLLSQMHRLDEAGIRTVYATGNHDHGGARSRVRALKWPASFSLVRSPKPRRITMRDGAGEEVAVIVAAGHAGAQESENLAAAFPVADGPPHIGLLHTQVTSARGAELHDRYAPCAAEDLDRVGYAYWALGHIHTMQPVSENTPAYYSGVLQGRNPREDGTKGGLVVSIPDRGPVEVRFEEFGGTRFRTMVLDGLEGIASLEDLRRVVRGRFSSTAGEMATDISWILKVVLEGPCAMASSLRDDEQLEELSEVLIDDLGVLDLEVRTSALTSPVDVDSHRNQPSVVAEALALLDEIAYDRERIEELAGGILATGNDETVARDALTKGLDRELVERLLRRT